jgi:hypothetical protein
MAIERDDTEERKARIELMIGEFRTAQQRRLVRRGMGLWQRGQAVQMSVVYGPKPEPEKIH